MGGAVPEEVILLERAQRPKEILAVVLDTVSMVVLVEAVLVEPVVAIVTRQEGAVVLEQLERQGHLQNLVMAE
jgi:hypothetical protein